VIIIVYYAIRQQHTIYTVKYNNSTIKTAKIFNTDSNDIANTFHTADLTDTLYELISYLSQ